MVLEVVLGDFTEAGVIAGLLVFNAGVGLYQEGKAQTTLTALKSRLALNASVRRDGTWAIVASAGVVPGDLVKLSLGAVVPADVSIIEGQCSWTSHRSPESPNGGTRDRGPHLRRRARPAGEATARVTNTGPRTKFGNSAELVRTAHVESSQQKVVLRVVRNIALFNAAVIVALVAYATSRGLPWSATVPLILTAVLAAIPVALPATFTLAAALGAGALASSVCSPLGSRRGRGGLGRCPLCRQDRHPHMNKLSVDSIKAMSGYDGAHVLTYATLASDVGGQDPVDAAIREMGSQHG